MRTPAVPTSNFFSFSWLSCFSNASMSRSAMVCC
jgi:hypothetical protein